MNITELTEKNIKVNEKWVYVLTITQFEKVDTASIVSLNFGKAEDRENAKRALSKAKNVY